MMSSVSFCHILKKFMGLPNLKYFKISKDSKCWLSFERTILDIMIYKTYGLVLEAPDFHLLDLWRCQKGALILLGQWAKSVNSCFHFSLICFSKPVASFHAWNKLRSNLLRKLKNRQHILLLWCFLIDEFFFSFCSIYPEFCLLSTPGDAQRTGVFTRDWCRLRKRL